jgi:hypothetical protein
VQDLLSVLSVAFTAWPASILGHTMTGYTVFELKSQITKKIRFLIFLFLPKFGRFLRYLAFARGKEEERNIFVSTLHIIDSEFYISIYIFKTDHR